jgi:hypothetical protein
MIFSYLWITSSILSSLSPLSTAKQKNKLQRKINGLILFLNLQRTVPVNNTDDQLHLLIINFTFQFIKMIIFFTILVRCDQYHNK